MNNKDNSHMKNPYKCCTYFLGLFKGEKVKDWVEDQATQLREKTTCLSDCMEKNNVDLWDDLIANFVQAYTHTGKVEQAWMELAKLEMKGNQVDNYIVKFENLLWKSDIPQTKVGSIQKFKDGLRKGVLSAILRCDQWPETINEWEEHARCEVRRFKIIKESLRDKGNTHLSTK